MEFLLGGLAACGATLFSNPAEVVKTRMQLQGELQKKGLYTKHYKNVVHAFFQIAKSDGFLALQKGLAPALVYQLIMNGTRLGVYTTISQKGFLLRGKDGKVSTLRSALAGAIAGCVGGFLASPLYLVKTHLQVQSLGAIAVGHQHHHENATSALKIIFKQSGVKGLWRGSIAALPRITIGSAVQLSTYSKMKSIINNFNWKCCPPNSLSAAFVASIISGMVVSTCMTPLDVVSTRLYNQGVTPKGQGMMYSGFLDCAYKTYFKEGFWGFYKGWTASFLRLGPHTVLTLTFWDILTQRYALLTGLELKFMSNEN